MNWDYTTIINRFLFSLLVSLSATSIPSYGGDRVTKVLYLLAGFVTAYILVFYLTDLTPKGSIDRVIDRTSFVTIFVATLLTALNLSLGSYGVSGIIAIISDSTVLSALPKDVSTILEYNVYLFFSFFTYLFIYGIVEILVDVFAKRNINPQVE